MKRRFDWYGLTLPVVLVVGLACLGISLLGNATGFAVVGWILVGVAILAAPFWIVSFVRARGAWSQAAAQSAEVRFLASIVSDDGRSRGRGLVVGLADRDGVRVVQGRTSEVRWSARWSELGDPVRGSIRPARTEFPTIAFDRGPGDSCVLAIYNPNGWPASFAFADDLQAELRRLHARSARP